MLQDLVQYLREGKLSVMKSFLKIKHIFERSEPRYLLNTLYIDDFCVFLQKVDKKEFEDLAAEIEGLKIEKKELGLELEEIEKEALEIIEDEKNAPLEEENEDHEVQEDKEKEEVVKKEEEKPKLIEVIGETVNDKKEDDLENLE